MRTAPLLCYVYTQVRHETPLTSPLGATTTAQVRTQRREANLPPRSASRTSLPGAEGLSRVRTPLPAVLEEPRPSSTVPARLCARLLTPAGAGPAAAGAGRALFRPGRAAGPHSGGGTGGVRGREQTRPRGYALGRWCRRPALGSSRAREGAPSSASFSCCSAPAVGACRAAGPRGRLWCWVRAGRGRGAGMEPCRAVPVWVPRGAARSEAPGASVLGNAARVRAAAGGSVGRVGSGGCVSPRSLRAAENNRLGSPRCADECYRPVLPPGITQ